MPPRATPPDNDPVYPMALYSASAKTSKLASRIEGTVKRLKGMKYPVTVQPLGDQPRYLNDQELAELVRWLDTLDRI